MQILPIMVAIKVTASINWHETLDNISKDEIQL